MDHLSFNGSQHKGEHGIQCEKIHPDDRNVRKQITIQQLHGNNIAKMSSKQKQLNQGKTHVVHSLKMDSYGKIAKSKERSASITYIKEADISYDFTSPRQQTSEDKCSRVSSNLDIHDARLYTIPNGHSWHSQSIKLQSKSTKITVFANKMGFSGIHYFLSDSFGSSRDIRSFSSSRCYWEHSRFQSL